ncbi:MAG: hypothetical protein NTW03_18830 [Verrucomicrobia bacterium]|nr:hypothetical protein [Verrucomicrobiota bacterium]
MDQKIDDPSMVVQVLALRHNDSGKVATTLESIFTARQRARTVPGQPPSPQDTVKIETDALNNALVLFASKENQELAKGLLEKIDAEPTIIGGLVEAFILQYADAQRVASMLRTLVQQGLYRPGAAVTAAKGSSSREALAVTVDPRSNTLIISASPENLLVVKEIIKRVDTKDFAGEGDVRVYALKKTRASSVATVLEQFFRAKKAGEAIAINAPERSMPVAVIPDDRSNVLLVTGSKESFDVMDRLVKQLDGEDVFARMNFRIFPLQKATAMKLQGTLRQIVANRPPRTKGEPAEPITIVADQWVNALLIGASVDDLTLVASLIEQLDTEQTELGIAVQVLPLAKGDARRVAQTVQALFREGTSGTGATTALPVMVNADERMNALVVSAGAADAKRIAELVKKLDTDQVARVSEIKIFPLRNARAESLSTILNTALNTKPASLSELSPNTQSLLQFITRTEQGRELVTAALKEAVLITPDPRMNALIVSGPMDYMGLLEQIITRLDTSSPQVARIKVFTLVNADAHQMGQMLMQMFRMQATGAAVANQRTIQYTLMRPNFDSDTVMDEEEELASATLGTAEQSALTITVDPRTNSLLVGGTDHYVELVSKIIESLDGCPARERKSELYRLRNAQAQEVATAIRSFLDQERQRLTAVLGADAVGTTQRLLDREVAIVAEQVSNTLLISTNPRFFEEIIKLVEDLDQPQPQVLIQVLLAEVTLDTARDLGVEWRTSGSFEHQRLDPGTDFGMTQPINPASASPTTFGLAPDGGLSTVVTGDKLHFYLAALQNDGRLEVLSRPQILTGDNKPASINIGQRVPIIRDSRTGGDVNLTTINSYNYEEVGVTLTVTPRIAPDGMVRMEVGTTNSTMSSSGLRVSSTLELPVFNQRRATTTVSVQTGQTVIIGGLISTTDDVRTKSVPILGSIPVLGVLFRSHTKSTERRELLIFLTPQVVLNVKDMGHTPILSGTDSNRGGRMVITNAIDMKTMTEREIRNSTIKTEIKRDALQHQLLDPIFPLDSTNRLDGGKSPKAPPESPAPPAKKLL